MKLFNLIAISAIASTSLTSTAPAEAGQNYYSTCTIKRLSTGELTYQKCNTEGARMLDGRHQVTRIDLANGNVIEKDGRTWNYHGPDCFENGRDYVVCR